MQRFEYAIVQILSLFTFLTTSHGILYIHERQQGVLQKVDNILDAINRRLQQLGQEGIDEAAQRPSPLVAEVVAGTGGTQNLIPSGISYLYAAGRIAWLQQHGVVY
jgi:hypothetical protein